MGAHNVSHRVPQQYKSEQELRSYWGQFIDRLLIEEGTDCYNGTFTTCRGLQIEQKTFDDEPKADEYILDHTQKWSHALAVKVKTVHVDYRLIEQDEKLKALRDERRVAERAQNDAINAVLDSMHQGAATRACRCCKSKVAMTWTDPDGRTGKLRSATCPVCRTGSMLLKGEEAAITRAKTALPKVELKLAARDKDLRDKLKAKGTPVEYWYVAGWAAS